MRRTRIDRAVTNAEQINFENGSSEEPPHEGKRTSERNQHVKHEDENSTQSLHGPGTVHAIQQTT